MWLDDLARLFADLRSRATEYGTELRRNEALTRAALIDPVLVQLGWDVHDPGQMIPEYHAGRGRVDYALFDGQNARPVAFVEAKSLGTPLADKLAQAITYCNEQGVKYFAVTDGQRWEIYETFRAVPNPDKLIFKVDLGNDPDHRSALRLLWLWRGNFTGHGDPETATFPDAETPSTGGAKSSDKRHRQPTRPNGTSRETDVEGNWKPLRSVLSDLRRTKGQPPPSGIRFPDGESSAVKTWRDLQVSTANWLVSRGRLSASRCPVVTSRGTHIVHREPTRSDGSPFVSPVEVAGMWLDLNWSAMNHARLTLELVGLLGEDPESVFVRWS